MAKEGGGVAYVDSAETITRTVYFACVPGVRAEDGKKLAKDKNQIHTLFRTKTKRTTPFRRSRERRLLDFPPYTHTSLRRSLSARTHTDTNKRKHKHKHNLAAKLNTTPFFRHRCRRRLQQPSSPRSQNNQIKN